MESEEIGEEEINGSLLKQAEEGLKLRLWQGGPEMREHAEGGAS
jgi:hypothetical protein